MYAPATKKPLDLIESYHQYLSLRKVLVLNSRMCEIEGIIFSKDEDGVWWSDNPDNDYVAMPLQLKLTKEIA